MLHHLHLSAATLAHMRWAIHHGYHCWVEMNMKVRGTQLYLNLGDLICKR